MGADTDTFAVVSNTTTITTTDANVSGGSNSQVVALATPDAVITDSTWTHIRFVENGNDYYIFIDGIQKAHVNTTARTSGAQTYDSDFYINANYDGTTLGTYGDGYWDEVRITNSALSTGNFDVPSSAYTSATTNVNMRIGNTLPVDGFNFTVSNANTSTGSMSVYYWASGQWNAVTTLVDGTNSGSGIPLDQSGSVTFDSTANIAQPKMWDGIYGFWYKIEVTDADTATAISNVTVSEPFQAIQDFWDGLPRTSPSVQLFTDDINQDNTVNVFKDEYVYDETTKGDLSSYMIMNELETSTEYLTLGFSERMQGVQFKMIPNFSNDGDAASGTLTIDQVDQGNTLDTCTVNGVSIISGTLTAGTISEDDFTKVVTKDINDTVSSPNYTATVDGQVITITAEDKGSTANGYVIATTDVAMDVTGTDLAGGSTASAVLTVYYWSGTAWVTVGTIDDGTIDNGSSMAKSGYVTWNPIAANTEFKKEINKEEPLYYYKFVWNEQFSKEVFCYNVSGIPVQMKISNYKFPINAQGRLFLFSNQAENKNEVIVSNLNTLNVFNGEDSGDPISFGDSHEIVAATELFERTTTKVESHLLVLKENSTHILEGSSPEDWHVVNLASNIGCNAPYTLSTSTLGIESAPLTRKQVAIWQGSSGLHMFDNSAIHPISDDISYFFDSRNADSINLSYADQSYGFFTVADGEHFYHWGFCSGSNTTCDKEWVLDIKRQKWFEMVRGTAKALQGGAIVTDVSGNIYNYGFIDTGYVQKLNDGTTFDGEDIVYEFSTGDILPSGEINTLTSVDSIRLATVSKETTSNSILAYHYGDTKDAATTDQVAGTAYYTLATANTGSRVAFPFKRINTPPHMTHKLKFTMTTDDETVGFEPLFIGGFYKARSNSELNITD